VACAGAALSCVAQEFSLAVVVTNHVVGASSVDVSNAGSGQEGTAAHKPALGEQWRAYPHARIQLIAGRANLLGAFPVGGGAIRDPAACAQCRLHSAVCVRTLFIVHRAHHVRIARHAGARGTTRASGFVTGARIKHEIH
jgi:hypothetical protein